MFGLLLGLLQGVLMVPIAITVYCLMSYFIGRLSKKKDPNVSMLVFFIPIYRYYKLLKVYNQSFTLFIGLNINLITMPLTVIMMGGGSISGVIFVGILGYIITAASLGILWGHIAEEMGDKFGLWCLVGVLTAIIPILGFLTPLIFALSNCMPGGTGVIAAGTAPQPQTAVKRRPTQLYCSAGEHKGDTMMLKNGLKIGRAPEMDIVLGASEVSRQHAILSFSNGKLLLTDCSQNGTFLLKDGKKLRIVKDAYLEAGDVFEIGSTPERFVVR